LNSFKDNVAEEDMSKIEDAKLFILGVKGLFKSLMVKVLKNCVIQL
jgi:hypothetical protein